MAIIGRRFNVLSFCQFILRIVSIFEPQQQAVKIAQ